MPQPMKTPTMVQISPIDEQLSFLTRVYWIISCAYRGRFNEYEVRTCDAINALQDVTQRRTNDRVGHLAQNLRDAIVHNG